MKLKKTIRRGHGKGGSGGFSCVGGSIWVVED